MSDKKKEPDESMLKHLDLLLNMEILESEEDWKLLEEMKDEESSNE